MTLLLLAGGIGRGLATGRLAARLSLAAGHCVVDV
jgi:hypothetical protein